MSEMPCFQATLLGQARCALGYGVDSARFAWRCGIYANKKLNHTASRRAPEPSTLAPPVFPPHVLRLPNSAWERGSCLNKSL